MSFLDKRGQILMECEATNFNDKVIFFEGVNLVGRNPAKTRVTIKDRSISQIHGKIICRNNTIKVFDSKSKNGIYINSLQNQIEPETEVQINPKKDIVYFAQIKCKFILDQPKKQYQEDTKQFTGKAFKPNVKKTNMEQNQNQKNKQPLQQVQKSKNINKDVSTKNKFQHQENLHTKDLKKTKKQQQQQKQKLKQKQKQKQIQRQQQKSKQKQKQKLKQKQKTKDNKSKQSKNQKQEAQKSIIDQQQRQQNKNKEKQPKQQNKQQKKKSKKQSKQKANKSTSKDKDNQDKITKKQNKQMSDSQFCIINDMSKNKKVSNGKENQKQLGKDKSKKQTKQSKQTKDKKQKNDQKMQEYQPKEDKQVNQNQNKKKQSKEKRGDTGQTKVKGRQRRKNKSAGKIEQEQKLIGRKKPAQQLNQSFHSRRSTLQKTALISGFTMAFKPTVKITVSQNWRQRFDVLVMEKFSRTFKLLYAICMGIPIVNYNWILQSQYRRGIVPYERFYLQSPQKDLISRSVALAKQGNKVFDNIKFYLVQTPQQTFHLPQQQIQALIQVGGGTIVKSINKRQHNIREIVFIVKLKYGNQQIKTLKKIEGAQKIYTIQLILDSCMHQRINWEENKIQKL